MPTTKKNKTASNKTTSQRSIPDALGYAREVWAAELVDPYHELIEQLFQHGGTRVIFDPEWQPFLHRVLESGTLVDATNIEWVGGVLQKCHYNSLEYSQSSTAKLMTGFALHDGEWVSHSWLCKADGTVIETTLPFDAYFGFELNAEEREYSFELYGIPYSKGGKRRTKKASKPC